MGGGVFNYSGASFSLHSTIVAGNSSSNSTQFGYLDDCAGTLNASGSNLFKAVLASSNCTVIPDVDWGYINSLNTLGPLQNNGGPTWTHALLPGSNAIDTAYLCTDYNSNPLLTDQRGAERIVDGNANGNPICDIGAFEYRPPLLLPLITR